MEWVKYMTSPKVQSKLVYTKAFKPRPQHEDRRLLG